jgi:hypothetical protein
MSKFHSSRIYGDVRFKVTMAVSSMGAVFVVWLVSGLMIAWYFPTLKMERLNSTRLHDVTSQKVELFMSLRD